MSTREVRKGNSKVSNFWGSCKVLRCRMCVVLRLYRFYPQQSRTKVQQGMKSCQNRDWHLCVT